MSKTHNFFANPILNSPYEEPTRHHDLDESGQPTNAPPRQGRRRSSLYSPVPKAKRSKKAPDQPDMLESVLDQYNPHNLINEIRAHVKTWRQIPSPADWGVTPTTQRLLQYWRNEENFETIRPFFCQREAVETMIWLMEVARKQKKYANIWNHIKGGNAEANPELLRLALKMATGAGKTTVMAMLIAWQTLNAVRSPGSKLFTRGFLIITPGITIKDRLRVLQPGGTGSYYTDRELIPTDMVADLARAKVVITNYHAFQRREKVKLSKGTRSAISGWRGENVKTLETEGEMLRRALGDLMGTRNILVINDEAHHCYRENPESRERKSAEGKENAIAARLWINGIEAIKRKMGLAGVYDLSATPFFLAGSGYREGTLFPWTVSDFSLMDAIECGIVKLPRVPILDNMPTQDGEPVYRDLWKYIGKKMPKKGRKKGGVGPVEALPLPLQTALKSLYGHYEKTDQEWRANGHKVPPVFIIVCNNTSTSQIVYDWVAGYEMPETNTEPARWVPGQLGLFSNFDEHGQRLDKPNTLLIDSAQLESGEGMTPQFKKAMASEIELFQRQYPNTKIDDEQLLREVMNTVGEKGSLGGNIRCVVSVSMLTEGWDANTVTHILGIRAFGTQLICEQVVGRALRRKSYELNKDGLFNVEYADIMGIPFNFTAKPTIAPPSSPPPTTRVAAVKDRARLEIRFPRVTGYRTELPDKRIGADFNADSTLTLTPELVGPCTTIMSGIVGETQTMEARDAFEKLKRPSSLAYHVTKRLLYTRFRDENARPDMNLFASVKRIVKQWLEEGYLKCTGNTVPGMLAYQELADMAAEKVFLAYNRWAEREGQSAGAPRIKAIIDPYNPEGSTRHVGFTTSKPVFATDPNKSHVSHVVEDSTWEAEMARVAEAHPKVLAYVKNQGLGLEVPYHKGSSVHPYVPDFIVKLDTGGEPLHVIVEIKGYRNSDAVIKADTMKSLWVPGVNNAKRFGQWAFVEFLDVFEIEEAFKKMVAEILAGRSNV